jgi:hypothetical protein
VCAADFFLLPTHDEINLAADPIGGRISSIRVTVADGTWWVSGADPSAEERGDLDAAQALIPSTVGPDPYDPVGSAATATPVAG